MAHRTSGTPRTLALALLLLAASPISTRAGFVWLAPDGSPTSGTGAPAQPGEAPAVPDTGTVAMPLSPQAPPPSTPPVLSSMAPVERSEPILPPVSAPDMSVLPQATQASGVALTDGVVMGTPVYARGDQTSTPVVRPTALQPLAQPLAASDLSREAGGARSPLTGSVVGGDTMDATPVAPIAQEQPVTLSPLQPSSAPAPDRLSPLTGQDVAAQPAAVPAASVEPGAMSSPPTPSGASGSEPIAEGFGKQVPLIIALRQILPSTYGFAHRDGVDLTRSVNWQGGRPWPQVLADALRPLGLRAQISGDTVLIERAEDRSAVASPAGSGTAPVTLTPSANARIPSATSPLPSPAVNDTREQGVAPELVTPISTVSYSGAAPGSAQLGQGTVIQSPSSNR